MWSAVQGSSDWCGEWGPERCGTGEGNQKGRGQGWGNGKEKRGQILEILKINFLIKVSIHKKTI